MSSVWAARSINYLDGIQNVYSDVPVIVIVVHCIEAGWYCKMAAGGVSVFLYPFLSFRYSLSFCPSVSLSLRDWIRGAAATCWDAKQNRQREKAEHVRGGLRQLIATRNHFMFSFDRGKFFCYRWTEVLLLLINAIWQTEFRDSRCPCRIIAYTIIASFCRIKLQKN